jgi:hypothetical protein
LTAAQLAGNLLLQGDREDGSLLVNLCGRASAAPVIGARIASANTAWQLINHA